MDIRLQAIELIDLTVTDPDGSTHRVVIPKAAVVPIELEAAVRENPHHLSRCVRITAETAEGIEKDHAELAKREDAKHLVPSIRKILVSEAPPVEEKAEEAAPVTPPAPRPRVETPSPTAPVAPVAPAIEKTAT